MTESERQIKEIAKQIRHKFFLEWPEIGTPLVDSDLDKIVIAEITSAITAAEARAEARGRESRDREIEQLWDKVDEAHKVITSLGSKVEALEAENASLSSKLERVRGVCGQAWAHLTAITLGDARPEDHAVMLEMLSTALAETADSESTACGRIGE